jgi:photosystem II stability/assembly factor-like uncharacterized protein
LTSNGLVLHSSDGGNQWQQQNFESNTAFYSSLSGCCDGRGLWSPGLDGTVLHTNDNGLNWVATDTLPDKRLKSVVATEDGREMWAVGDEGAVIHSSDGGWNWTDQSTETGTLKALDGAWSSPDGSDVWIVGESSTLLHSRNHGSSSIRARAVSLDSGAHLSAEASIELLNAARLNGRDWLGASGELDARLSADSIEEMEFELIEDFDSERKRKEAENADRIQFQLQSVRAYRDRKVGTERQRIGNLGTEPRNRGLVRARTDS